MVAVEERTIYGEARRGGGRLSERVEQDLAEALDEFGSQAVEHDPEQAANAPQVSFGYGIPMAGVRYYSFTPEG